MWSYYDGLSRGPESKRRNIVKLKTGCCSLGDQIQVELWSQAALWYYSMIFFYLQAGFFYFHWWVECIKPQWVFNESCSCVFNVRSFDWYIGGLNAYMPCQTWSIPCSDLTLFLDIKLTLFLNFLKNSHLNVCIQWIRIYPFRQYKTEFSSLAETRHPPT